MKTRGKQRRPDPVAGKRMLRAALYFAGAMIGVGGSLVWAIQTSKGGVNDGWAATAVGVFLLVLFAAVVNVFVAYGRMMWFFRCPQCRARLTREPGRPGRTLKATKNLGAGGDCGAVTTNDAGMAECSSWRSAPSSARSPCGRSRLPEE